MIFILLMMVLMHVIEDFHVQGIMGNMKQKRWWCDELAKMSVEQPDTPMPELMGKYGNDYIPVLLLHGFEWSMFVHAPILVAYWVWVGEVMLGGLFMSIMCLVIVLQGVLHSIIDHFKANRLKINLIADQSLHMLQIAVSFCIFVMYIVG